MVAQKNPHVCESVRDEHLSDMIVTQPEDWILMEEELYRIDVYIFLYMYIMLLDGSIDTF